jgi:integrase
VTGKQKGARANREGDPWKRADGRWVARVWPPRGSLERKPRYVYGRNRNEVIAKRRDLEVQMGRGLPSDPDQTVGDYFHRWLAVTLPQYVAAGEMAESTMDSYRDNARKHIVPEDAGPTLGHIKLTELSAPAVREWQKQLAQKPSGRARRTLRDGETELPSPGLLSVRTVAYCRAILHKAMEDALRDEAAGLERNVVSLVKPPRKRQKKSRATVPPEQVGRLLVAMADDRLWCYWFLAFALGFRRGEGLGMEWADLDFAKRTWTPKHSVQRMRLDPDPKTGKRKGHLVAKELKTEASTSAVPVPARAIEALQRWQREQRKMRMSARYWRDDLDFVFTTRTGSALEPRGINRAWERLCEKAGVPVVRLHDLRHACASYLLNAGADLVTVQGYLRHADSATTRLYLHALEEVSRTGADVMDTILGNLFALAEESGS